MSTFTEHRPSVGGPDSDGTPATPGPHGRPSRRTLVVLTAVLAAAVLGLGAWLVVERTSTTDTAITGEVQQLLDEYYDAWNTWDGDAYLGLVTEDGSFAVTGRTTSTAQQATIIEGLERVDWHVETIGEPIMVGEGPWYVTQADHLTGAAYPDGGHQGISTFTIVEDAGTLLISHHVYTGEW